MLVADNCVVSIHYTLTDDSGEEIDSSAGHEPLAYLHGAGNIVPGLEDALDGKQVGDRLSVVIQPEDGYGEIDPDLIQSVPRSAFQGVKKIEPGMQFESQSEDGDDLTVTVQEVRADEVIVNGNHPLAGIVLHFEVSIEEIRPATEEEIEHGHAHGPEGHEHD